MPRLRLRRRAPAVILLVACGVLVRCSDRGADKRVMPSYDLFTSQLVQLSADLNGDGRTDQWSYMSGNRPIRGEADTDGDGRIDRWEYFDDRAALVTVGSSSANDGIEDTWTSPESSSGEIAVARARRRDRLVDRREVYRQGALVSAEEDSNADGKMDQWSVYENGALREVRLDTSLSAGRPDRRLVYDARGGLMAIERDPDGDGRFEAVQPALQPPASGVRK